MSDRNVSVAWMASTPDNLTVYAAIHARETGLRKGSETSLGGHDRNTLTFYGSIASGQSFAGSGHICHYNEGMTTFLGGYQNVDIYFDDRLLTNPPPGFPTLAEEGSSEHKLKVVSWVEE